MSGKAKKSFSPFESPAWSLLMKPESELNRDTREYFSAALENLRLNKLKNKKADLKFQHKKIYELALAVTLVFLITGFQLARYFSFEPISVGRVDLKIEVADIPVTEQFRRPPPPVRPSIPIPTDEENIPEDETIASTDINLSNVPPPPPPPEDENDRPIFVTYDEPPKIIGGIAELQKHLVYPKIARRANIEGIVYLRVLVSANGITEKVETLKAKPANIGFDESAIEAVKKVRWVPARQRDRKIRVWVSIPVVFKLVDASRS